MNFNEGLSLLWQKIVALNDFEYVSLDSSLGRILANDVVVTKNIPCFDNSALDGYAFKFDDLQNGFEIAKETIYAGEKRNFIAQKGEAYRIMTGGKMPQNTDTIVRLENAIFENDKLIIENVKKHDGWRIKGEDMKIGEILLTKGTKITPSHIMALASQGICDVCVITKPKIALYSSGDEVVRISQKADENEIYDANSSTIGAMLKTNGFDYEMKGIIADSKDKVREAFENSAYFDAIICSGGASVGDKDFMKEILLSLGFNEIFDRLNLKPGGPFKTFHKNKQFVFILPGNPLSAFFTAFFGIIPAIRKLGGSVNFKHESILARNLNPFKLTKSRYNAVLGNYINGKFARFDKNYGAAMIKPLTQTNAIYLSDENLSTLEADEMIEIYKF